MARGLRLARRLLVRGGLALGSAAAVAGCRGSCPTGDCSAGPFAGGHGGIGSKLDRCSDVPPGSLPEPLGTFSNELLCRQAAKGEADQFVIYYNEWLDYDTVLGPFGSDHFARIVARLPLVPLPVVLQPEPDKPELNTRRHAALVAALTQARIPDADKRVIVGTPWAEGLFGEESQRAYAPIPTGGGNGNANGFGGGRNGFGGGFNGGGFGNGFGGGFGNGFGGGGFGGGGFGGGGFGGNLGFR